jgi:hypothetical protein
MDRIECQSLWKEAIRLCEMEPNKEEAISFVMQYYRSMGLLYYNDNTFCTMNERNLLLTFIGLVVYEKKFNLGLGSTTPTTFCYKELLERADNGYLDKEFVYDVGDWAADYSDNEYVPMGNFRGYGPRQYFAFWDEYRARVALEKQAKEERLERKRAEGRAKVKAAKLKHQERLNTIQQLKEKTIEDCIEIIGKSDKSVFYYYELIEEWFNNKSLSDNQKEKILSMFPTDSTRHNIRKRKYLEEK